MMKKMIGAAVAALTMLAASAPAMAQADGDYFTFDLYNGSSYTILTFQTGEPNGTYSQDWLPGRILASGDSVPMRFYDSDDACQYYVKVVFAEGGEFEQQFNFCELESVLVTDTGIETYE